MVDIFLILLVLVVIGIAIAVNVHILIHFQSPEDSNFAKSILMKVVIVFGLTLSWIVVLLLPVDVRNSRPEPGPLDLAIVWFAAFITLAVFVVIVIPGAMFYYDVEYDDLVKRKLLYVGCNLFLVLFFASAAVGISFPFLAKATLPVMQYSCTDWVDSNVTASGNHICSQSSSVDLEIQVSFQVYFIGCFCFFGWFFLAIFGGIGLSAAPLEMILSFIDRPKSIDEVTYRKRRKIVGEAAAALLAQAEQLQDKDNELLEAQGNLKPSKTWRWRGFSSWKVRRSQRQLAADYNEFQRDLMILEEEFERLKISKFNKGESLAVSIVKLIVGIIFGILSLAWVLHIILYVLVGHITNGKTRIPFLNGLFASCESSGLYPLGIALFAIFNLYLLYCVVKGCLKFGMRVVLCFRIHPMRVKATPLNSILFNVEMVLISSAGVAQFSQTCFSDYTRLTDADTIFAAEIKHLMFFKYLFENNVFIYLLLSLSLVAVVYFCLRPRDASVVKFNKDTDDKLASLIGVATQRVANMA